MEDAEITCEGRSIKLTSVFLIETLKARQDWTNVLQILRDYRWLPRLFYPANLSIMKDGENEIFHDKSIFKQHQSTNSAIGKV